MVMVKAKAGFPFAIGGTDVVTVEQGQVFDCPDDVAVGLKAASLVEDAGEGAEATPPKATTSQAVGVTDTSVLGGAVSLEPTELSDKQKAELTAARTVEVPVVAQPDIEPVEHGGETLDRILTRGVDSDALLVENSDPVAQAGKGQAIAEVTGESVEDETVAVAEEGSNAGPAAAEEGKALTGAPENKAARRSSKKS